MPGSTVEPHARTAEPSSFFGVERAALRERWRSSASWRSCCSRVPLRLTVDPSREPDPPDATDAATLVLMVAPFVLRRPGVGVGVAMYRCFSSVCCARRSSGSYEEAPPLRATLAAPREPFTDVPDGVRAKAALAGTYSRCSSPGLMMLRAHSSDTTGPWERRGRLLRDATMLFGVVAVVLIADDSNSLALSRAVFSAVDMKLSVSTARLVHGFPCCCSCCCGGCATDGSRVGGAVLAAVAGPLTDPRAEDRREASVLDG